MFSQASVIRFTGLWCRGGWCRGRFRRRCLPGGGCLPGERGDCPGGVYKRGCLPRHTPLRDGYCRGRYASYWNAFLLIDFFIFECC